MWTKNWDDIEVVKLSRLFEQQSWFRGSFRFSHGWTKELWEIGTKGKLFKDKTGPPNTVCITIPYKSIEVSFTVTDRGYKRPKYTIMYHNEVSYGPRVYRKAASTHKTVVLKIAETLTMLLPKMEIAAAKETSKRLLQTKKRELRENLQEEWGVQIHNKEHSWQRDEDMWTYAPTKGTYLSFYPIDEEHMDLNDDDRIFVIHEFEGQFTKEDMQKLIKIIGSSRIVVAKRMKV